jgi:hypothetical protein
MRWHKSFVVVFAAAAMGVTSPPLQAQGVGKYLAPNDQVIAIRAGKLFDARSGSMLTNQVVLLKGDRITDVGAAVQISASARVIDLSAATVMPGMIDAHVHVNTNGTIPNLAARALRALNQRATYYPDNESVRTYDGFTEGKNINSPWLAIGRRPALIASRRSTV